MTEQHSPLAVAFLETVLASISSVPAKARPFYVVICRPNEPPHAIPRAALIGHLKTNGLDDEPSKLAKRKVAPHCTLVWIESDECTFALMVPWREPADPKLRGANGVACALPDDAVIASLLGDSFS